MTSDSRQLLAANWDKCVGAWDFETGDCTLTLPHNVLLNAIALTPNGRYLVSAGQDSVGWVWDLRLVAPFAGPTPNARGQARQTDSAGPSAAERPFFVWCRPFDAGDEEWLQPSAASTHVLSAESPAGLPAAFTPDWRHCVLCLPDGEIQVRDTETGDCARAFAETRGCSSFALAPEGDRLLTGRPDGLVRVWALGSGECVCTLEGEADAVCAVEVTPDGLRVAAGAVSGGIRVWALGSGKCLWGVAQGHAGSLNAIEVTPDGQWLLTTGSDCIARVWDLRTGVCVRDVSGHTGPISLLAVAPDAAWFVTGSADCTARVWDLASGLEVACLPAQGSVVHCQAGRKGRLKVSAGLGIDAVLVLENMPVGPPCVTAWCAPRSAAHAFDCPACRNWSRAPAWAVGAAFPCSGCGELARLNPFVIRADWRLVEKARRKLRATSHRLRVDS